MSRNELFVIQEQIWSAFEQDVAANGILAVMAKRTLDNQIAEVEGKFAAFGDTLAGLWGAAVDAGDLVVTGVLGGDDAQSLYEFVSGSEVGSLTERNNLAKGAVEVATNTVEYVENVASGKKSWQDVAQDAGDAAVSIGTGLYNDYIDPFVKDEKYKQDNLHGGLWTRSVWTRSVDESYAKGQNEFKKDMVVAEAVLTVYSGGMGTAALKGGKSVAKLDVDAPHGKQPHADVDADGGKGRGGLLHGSGVDDLLEGTPLKDGKLKTKAKLFDDVLKDFDLLTEKYQHNMLKQIFEKIRIKEEVMVDPVFGQSFSVWNISFFKDKKGGHGLQHIETSKGHVSEAPRNKDIPHEITPPKGGKASGDSGHSHHDEPVTDKKGNDANKNQPYEKEKAGAEGTGNVPPVIKTFNISEEALDHANIGDFTKNPRTGAIQKMSGGGHGQDNIDFLEQNGIEYNIETTFPNGVRIGNVPEHKSKGKRTGTGQAWFPSNWNKEDIRRAGEYVANLPQNQGIADGVGVFGNYNGVRVGVIKTNGEIGTVFPDNSMQP